MTKKQLIITVIAVAGVIGLLAVIIMPNFVRARENGYDDIMMLSNNLRIIQSAKEQWALENKKEPGDPVSLTDLTAYFKNQKIPEPLHGETYQTTTVGEHVIATLPKGKTLNSKPGPFTITNI